MIQVICDRCGQANKGEAVELQVDGIATSVDGPPVRLMIPIAVEDKMIHAAKQDLCADCLVALVRWSQLHKEPPVQT